MAAAKKRVITVEGYADVLALHDAGFEEAVAEEYPDYYRLSLGATRQRGGARFGAHCLKIEYTGGQREQGLYEFVHLFCAPQHETPRTYTFSLYLKGSRDGLKAWIRGTQMNPDTPYGENRTLALSTNWTRYAISGVIPAKARDDGMFELRLMDPGALWADGLQLEAGAEPTEYEE